MTSKSKSKLIQSRPEPPGLEDVKSDLERAPNTDVAFTYFASSADSTSSEETGQKRSKSSGKDTGSGSKSDIDICYTKVIKFLELNEELKQSQESLQEQCNDLQELGQAVKEQVKSLRTQMT
ncbi:uncharacterized protein [Amphiura filiformis]|uniref:uncharacterized protein n=1 Tax=Amphiura filiformis TaxID=82378 RepID=UPI003B21BC2D